MHDLLQVCCLQVDGLLELEGLKGTLEVVARQALDHKLLVILTRGRSYLVLITATFFKETTDFSNSIRLFLIVNYRFYLRNQSFFLLHRDVKPPEFLIDMLVARR